MTLAELDTRLDDLARRARAREYRLELALAELRGNPLNLPAMACPKEQPCPESSSKI